jgi:hypothetical protein
MTDIDPGNDEGGESACFAHLICPECGVVLDGTEHVQGCTWVDPQSGLDADPTVSSQPPATDEELAE